jgi:hypothetical protein
MWRLRQSGRNVWMDHGIKEGDFIHFVDIDGGSERVCQDESELGDFGMSDIVRDYDR